MGNSTPEHAAMGNKGTARLSKNLSSVLKDSFYIRRSPCAVKVIQATRLFPVRTQSVIEVSSEQPAA